MLLDLENVVQMRLPTSWCGISLGSTNWRASCFVNNIMLTKLALRESRKQGSLRCVIDWRIANTRLQKKIGSDFRSISNSPSTGRSPRDSGRCPMGTEAECYYQNRRSQDGLQTSSVFYVLDGRIQPLSDGEAKTFIRRRPAWPSKALYRPYAPSNIV